MSVIPRSMTPRPAPGLIAIVLACCAANAVAQDRPRFEGTWSTTATLRDDPGWLTEDYFCFFGCTAVEYEHFGNLLDDPANDDRPLSELSEEAGEQGRLAFRSLLTPEAERLIQPRTLADQLEDICTPYGYFGISISVMPLRIAEEEDRLIFDYETHNSRRIVYLRGSAPTPPDVPGHFGHSVAYYDGDTLVIETIGVAAAPFYVSEGFGLKHSDRLTGVERYSLSDGGRQLDMIFSVEDPDVLTEPWVWVKKWRNAPDLELLPHEYDCSFIPGQR